MEQFDSSIFYYMGLPLLAMVYLILFTGVLPTPNNRNKYIIAGLGLVLSFCLFFVFPALLTN
ncbi:hypothetical protein [Vibrio alfacsensis]|uniref:hypothetical protein n=1 Tax=Vibrio alfacsensis TaxID=1074311 RepID=UPI001C8236E5|nr:hypothetical protein [Vibrio alfacsensis]